jgi:hypothetical protein
MTEEQAAEVMRQSVLFLSYSEKDGAPMPPCFLPGQRIWTDGGSIFIESIKTNDMVVTHTGKIKPVVAPMVREVRGEEIVVMKLMGSYCHQRLTKEHPVFSLCSNGRRPDLIRRSMRRGEKPEWRCAGALSVGDYVVIPKMRFSDTWRSTNLSMYGYKRSKLANVGGKGVTSTQIAEATGIKRRTVQRILCGRKIGQTNKATINAIMLCAKKLGWHKRRQPPPVVPLSEDFGFFVGQYVAEGSYSKTGVVKFASHAMESNIRNELLRVAFSIFGLRGSQGVVGNGGTVLICCTPLATALQNLCGKGAYNKVLPMRLMTHNKNFARGVIRGAWLGDGSVKSYEMGWAYTTMSSRLAHDMRQALTLFGILPSIKKSKRDEYVLTLSGRGRLAFADLLKLPAQKKARSGQGHIDSEYGFLIPIRKICTTKYDGPVYNLEVSDEPSYCVEGMASHNCEAMSCGCVVVGYHGIGGKEYFGKDFCITVEEENSLQYAKTLAEVMDKPQQELVELGKMASEWVTREYSTAREIASIKAIWDEVMEHKAAAIRLRERATAIFTVDDGKGLAEFLSVSSGFPDCHRTVMWRGSGLPEVPSDVEVVPYGDLARFEDGSHIALLTRLDDGNIEDCKKLIELGVPLVVNISGRKGVIEHEKTGFIYENPAWAGFWIRSLLTDRELMESFRKAKP